MKIAMAGDHAGFNLKKEIKELLESQGHEVIDFGPFSEESCDLPDFIYPASLAVSKGEVDRGIFIDGVGYGSALIANKIYGVYAAVCQDPFCAGLARSHSNTNVLCLGGKIIGSAIAQEIVKTWMTTDYLINEKRYTSRVDKVIEIADKALHIYTYSVIGFSIFMISQGVFIALGRTKVPLVMSILRIWLLRYIFILVTQKYLGLYSIFWGNLFSNTLAGIIFFILVKIINWKKGGISELGK